MGLLRPRILIPLALVVAIVVPTVTHWSWVKAEWRAALLLAEVTESGAGTAAAGMFTREPQLEESNVAGVQSTVARPAGDGPWPAVVFLTGVDELGRSNERVRAAARGLARGGFVVFLPDLEGLRESAVGTDVVDGAARYTLAAAQHHHTEGDDVALVSVSMGASLALLVAGDERTRAAVSTVIGVAPYADIRTVLMLATTGHYRAGDGEIRPYPRNAKLQRTVVLSALQAIRSERVPPHIVERLRSEVQASPDPLAPLRSLRDGPLPLPGDLSAVLDLLLETDPARFEERYAALGGTVRDQLERLSPIETAASISARVYLATSPRDTYFPPSETQRLVRVVPEGRALVTDALDHAVPELDSREELFEVNGFLVRALRDTAR
jgi:pimeloyl-ACP methyl ester carboxylesterase